MVHHGRMPRVALNDLDVYFEVHGIDDGVPLLHIGGSGGDLRRTFPDRHPLNKACRVLSFDQRGLGQTMDPTRFDDPPWTMEQYADDAAALMNTVGASMGWSRCNVMGTSFGGMVALHLALRHPELVDRLVLNCTSPGGEAPSFPLHELEGRPAAETFEIRMRLNDSRWDPDADEPIPGMGPYCDVMVKQILEPKLADFAMGLSRQLAARSGHDVVDRLPDIEHETLICAGRYDATAPMVNSELMQREMPNATMRTFDGGHLFFLQDRSTYRTIIEFLTTVGT